MKSFVRWSATLGLVGSTILASWLGYPLRALALSQEQILQKLNSIPVFTFANEQGGILLGAGENNKKVAYLFISQQQAQQEAERIAKSNPAQKVKILPLSLGEMYKAVTEKKNQPDTPLLDFVPNQQQVKAALTLLTQQNPQVKDFPGVPLFYATVTQNQKEAYLTYQDGKETVIPLFFEKEALQQVVDQFKKQKPEQASTVTMRVISLEDILGAFQSDKDESLNYMELIPSREAVEFILRVQQQQQQKNPSQPGTAPSNNSQPAPQK